MAFTDFFKKAKKAATEAKEKKKANRYGNQGAGQSAYEDAAKALEDEEKKGTEVASGD